MQSCKNLRVMSLEKCHFEENDLINPLKNLKKIKTLKIVYENTPASIKFIYLNVFLDGYLNNIEQIFISILNEYRNQLEYVSL